MSCGAWGELSITGLFVYPIKSCAGIALTEAHVRTTGIDHDRCWMVVDARGQFLTQREHPTMATIRPDLRADRLVVTADGAADLCVLLGSGDRAFRAATVWKFAGVAEDEGDGAADWFSARLGVSCRLVRTGRRWNRPVNPEYAQADDRVGFADGYPVLLATEASLADLNAHLPAPLPMDRFRPNLVLRGSGAWAEDGWRTLCGPATGPRFRVAKPCARCAITTIDQRTGARSGPEPLTALSRLRRGEDGKVLFGANLIPDIGGLLRIGDPVVAD